MKIMDIEFRGEESAEGLGRQLCLSNPLEQPSSIQESNLSPTTFAIQYLAQNENNRPKPVLGLFAILGYGRKKICLFI